MTFVIIFQPPPPPLTIGIIISENDDKCGPPLSLFIIDGVAKRSREVMRLIAYVHLVIRSFTLSCFNWLIEFIVSVCLSECQFVLYCVIIYDRGAEENNIFREKMSGPTPDNSGPLMDAIK